MEYIQYDPSISGVPKIIVDGFDCGEGLHLSHWPGNLTPHELKADLSVEIVLNFLTKSNLQQQRAYELVTNDHYDTDGVLAIWALMNKEKALAHAATIINYAETSDFYEWTTLEAFKFDCIIRALPDPECSPIKEALNGKSEAERETAATRYVLEKLPDLLYKTDSHKELWEGPLNELQSKIDLLNSSQISVQEYIETSLSVIFTPVQLDNFARNLFCKGLRILEVVATSDGYRYALYHREYLWYDIVKRPTLPKPNLFDLIDKLDELEANPNGKWSRTKWSPALFFINAESRMTDPGFAYYKSEKVDSKIEPSQLILMLIAELSRFEHSL
ncbi:DUF6687 family protein [Mucilaginibacter psychrotolerans]|uniref:Uncharacterized protein n=1 Tax=Mucilaginibacter psychrotolerans TaxID=1524096 RepID=A0A4Y8S822_9SPHI|nr:DUF6687 family protein [Mucilaginibacter psychrotolerans]TFF34574.1 hypothetical protein E2R66_21740 [Mucilaginibacter psychrotolerans]